MKRTSARTSAPSVRPVRKRWRRSAPIVVASSYAAPDLRRDGERSESSGEYLLGKQGSIARQASDNDFQRGQKRHSLFVTCQVVCQCTDEELRRTCSLQRMSHV